MISPRASQGGDLIEVERGEASGALPKGWEFNSHPLVRAPLAVNTLHSITAFTPFQKDSDPIFIYLPKSGP